MTQDIMRDLFQLQELEVKLTKMTDSLKEALVLQQIDTVRTDLNKLAKVHSALTNKIQENKKQLKIVEDQLTLVNEEVKGVSDKLYQSQETISFKELSGLQKRLEELNFKADELEVRVIEGMETIESLTGQLEKAEAVKAKLERKEEQYKREWEFQKASLEMDIQILTEEINGLRSQLPQDDLANYDRLKKSKGHRPIATVSHGVCQGCRVELPKGLSKNDPKNPPKCQNCGRYLLWP
jgi:predicted  nucleic acid-binding Zn-ribbon protein